LAAVSKGRRQHQLEVYLQKAQQLEMVRERRFKRNTTLARLD